MTILSRDFVFVYLAQQTNFISEVELAMELESSVSLVRQHLKDLGDVVETDGDGNWRIPTSGTKVKTEQEQRCLTWTNDNRYVWCARQSEKEIEEVSDRSLLLKELEQLHNLRQELFVRAYNTFDDLKKNQLLAAVKKKDEQIAWVKQKLGLSETDNYQIELYTHFIRRDSGTQPRAAMDENTVNEYAEAMDEKAVFPPVTVFFDGEFWLADGFHRLAAAEKAGKLKFIIEVRHGSKRDAILYAVGANATHGLRRSNEDKRRSIRLLLEDEEWFKWSDNRIAKQCGVAHPTVSKLRASLVKFTSEDKNYQSERFYLNKHGSKSAMKVEKIGKAPKKALKSSKPSPKEVREGMSYKAGEGIRWNLSLSEEVGRQLEDLKTEIGAATLEGAIFRLIVEYKDSIKNRK